MDKRKFEEKASNIEARILKLEGRVNNEGIGDLFNKVTDKVKGAFTKDKDLSENEFKKKVKEIAKTVSSVIQGSKIGKYKFSVDESKIVYEEDHVTAKVVGTIWKSNRDIDRFEMVLNIPFDKNDDKFSMSSKNTQVSIENKPEPKQHKAKVPYNSIKSDISATIKTQLEEFINKSY